MVPIRRVCFPVEAHLTSRRTLIDGASPPGTVLRETMQTVSSSLDECNNLMLTALKELARYVQEYLDEQDEQDEPALR